MYPLKHFMNSVLRLWQARSKKGKEKMAESGGISAGITASSSTIGTVTPLSEDRSRNLSWLYAKSSTLRCRSLPNVHSPPSQISPLRRSKTIDVCIKSFSSSPTSEQCAMPPVQEGIPALQTEIKTVETQPRNGKPGSPDPDLIKSDSRAVCAPFHPKKQWKSCPCLCGQDKRVLPRLTCFPFALERSVVDGTGLKTNLRAKAEPCYSTDSVEGRESSPSPEIRKAPSPPKFLRPDTVPFRLRQSSRSPEPSIFSGPPRELKTSTSSLDSITYVFLDQNEVMSGCLNPDEGQVQPCSSLSTLDSLEVGRDATQSPRTLSVDSVLFEECVRRVRAENEPSAERELVPAAMPQQEQHQRQQLESSGISSKSDSSSISVESGSSSSTTRRRGSIMLSPVLTDQRSNVQADLINLMSEVVQLLAFQQQKRFCRCPGHRHKKTRKPETFQQSKNQPQDSQRRRVEIHRQIMMVRAERRQVTDLLTRNKHSCQQTGSDHQTVLRKDDEHMEKGWKKHTNEGIPLLHDSGVDCCADSPVHNKQPEVKTAMVNKQTREISSQVQKVRRKESSEWSCRSEADKGRMLTWMEKELDFLERALGPVEYRALPDKFKEPRSLLLPLPNRPRTLQSAVGSMHTFTPLGTSRLCTEPNH